MAELPVTYRGVIQATHCDVNEHVNVMWITHYFDQASFSLVGLLGVDPTHRRERHATVVTAQYTFVYKRELVPGDLIAVRSRMIEVRDKAIRVLHELIVEPAGEVAATADFVGVYIDMQARRSRPIPDDVRARALALLKEHGADE